ncbi:signal peptidase I [Leucobacter rhizosphaerae]|uniref:Signal peptidase I n=1 Tax=Leucobacter rhizosphaerae TaxID=2932245 RepID=A0ABY4FRQ1_9MICO|nr:signal peptidase I [Leucobacter rhizosphaerae]UOQ58971.1 signal peptidase I [Leucobacter rhizosphaerae]
MLIKALGSAVTVCIIVAAVTLAAWFAFATISGATLITFRTGSMAPTMPQGSVAVTMPVAAAEIQAGDVVTVQRAGEPLPVTHRVTEVRTAANATSDAPLPEGARELVMRGDDNANADLLPYVVTDAKRVVLAIPGLGNALMMLQSPIGMGAMTIVAGALATWAFWPRSVEPASDHGTDLEPVHGAPDRQDAPDPRIATPGTGRHAALEHR